MAHFSKLAQNSFSLFPFAGWLFVGVVLWRTGLLVASYNQPWFWAFGNVFAWVELSVYSFVVVQSLRLFMFYRQRKILRFWYVVFKTVLFTLGVAGVVLFLSALLEFAVIHSS